MDTNDSIAIQQIIPPATMIPACGLLLLSSTARMNTVLARMRAFHTERLNIWKRDAQPGTREAAVRDLRLEGLEYQTHRLLRRAALLRITMLLLFGSIVCNALAVIGLAGSFVLSNAANTLYDTAAAVFILGILLILAAMVSSFIEVFRITETVRYEHERIERICTSDGANISAPALSPASGEGSGL